MGDIQQGAAAELWRSAIRNACAAGAPALDESQESYLVFVLLRHQRDAHLLARIQALEWLQAQELAGSVRRDALRDVGDRCLLVAGLFPAVAQRRRVSVEYYVDIGRSAWRGVAEAGRDAYAGLFAHLAEHYLDLVAVLRALRGEAQARLPAAMPTPARLH
jgi:hypothetical protein